LEFRILGEVEVRDGDRVLMLHGRRERALLAYLLLHANELVPSERLIEQLWGESPPATVATALHVYVSRLRKALGTNGSSIVTRAPGYLLEVDPEQVDARRFERLVESGRRALSEGDAATAAAVLRDALALWHGTPLSGIVEPEWAESEIRRLQELRLAALEERIESDLQLGRHAELISELEGLVARHPLRERFRAQLMLALYRSDRQSDALQVYTDTRRVLAEELGIDPSASLRRLEHAILEQDPSLEEPRTERSRKPRPQRRRKRILALAIAAVAVAVALLFALLTRGGSAVAVVPDSVAVIDTGNGHVVGDIPLGSRPSAIAAGAGTVWVADHDDGTLVRIDAATEQDRAIAVGLEPRSVAVRSNAVWATDGVRLVRLDARYGIVRRRSVLRLNTPGFGPDALSHGSPGVVASGSAGIWAAHGISSVSRIDSWSGEATRTVRLSDVPLGLAVADDSVWVVAPPTSRLISLDPATASVTGSAHVDNASYGEAGGYTSAGLAVDSSSVWVASRDGVTRIDRLGLGTIKRIHTSSSAVGVAIGDGSVWVSNNLAGTISRIDPRTNKVIATIRVGGNPTWIALTPDRLWVTVT
jgi:YVTN family beta-propeller protein